MEYSISNGKLIVTAESKGAQLKSIKMNDVEYMWQRDSKYWDASSPVLFPHVARLTDESYYMDDELHHMTIHGFAAASEFVCSNHTGTSMTFKLTDSEYTWQMYPRAFEFRVTYSIKDDTLLYRFEVENRDAKVLHFSVGAHPAFNVPISEGLDFSDYYLKFEENEEAKEQGDCEHIKRIDFSMVDIQPISGRMDFELDDCCYKLHHDMFDDDAIVLENVPHKVSIVSEKDEHSITVSWDNLPYLGIWHMPHTDAPYICIEPWSALPARHSIVEHFETQPDFIHLETGEKYESEIKIKLK